MVCSCPQMAFGFHFRLGTSPRGAGSVNPGVWNRSDPNPRQPHILPKCTNPSRVRLPATQAAINFNFCSSQPCLAKHSSQAILQSREIVKRFALKRVLF